MTLRFSGKIGTESRMWKERGQGREKNRKKQKEREGERIMEERHSGSDSELGKEGKGERKEGATRMEKNFISLLFLM